MAEWERSIRPLYSHCGGRETAQRSAAQRSGRGGTCNALHRIGLASGCGRWHQRGWWDHRTHIVVVTILQYSTLDGGGKKVGASKQKKEKSNGDRQGGFCYFLFPPPPLHRRCGMQFTSSPTTIPYHLLTFFLFPLRSFGGWVRGVNRICWLAGCIFCTALVCTTVPYYRSEQDTAFVGALSYLFCRWASSRQGAFKYTLSRQGSFPRILVCC